MLGWGMKGPHLSVCAPFSPPGAYQRKEGSQKRSLVDKWRLQTADFVLVDVTETRMPWLCVPWFVSGTAQTVTSSVLEHHTQTICWESSGKHRKLLPTVLLGRTYYFTGFFFCSSTLIELLKGLLPHKSFSFPKWNVSISADSVALMSASTELTFKHNGTAGKVLLGRMRAKSLATTDHHE